MRSRSVGSLQKLGSGSQTRVVANRSDECLKLAGGRLRNSREGGRGTRDRDSLITNEASCKFPRVMARKIGDFLLFKFAKL